MQGQETGSGGFDFRDATVVVTGAASGIGLSIAQAFHASGAKVAMSDVNKTTLDHAASAIGSERIFSGVADVRDENSVDDFFQAAEHALGPVTIGVANAGVFPNCPVMTMPVSEWDRVMETNLRDSSWPRHGQSISRARCWR